ncbi:MAG: putative alcohol dehydrogenase AdhA [Chlamydiales bacterium]|nr:putative alcohol dehydrogenase AdhA [Chlamydiales bacterium]
MKAMVLKEISQPLVLKEIPQPEPNSEQVLIKVSVCALCRTDLHIIDGELPHPKLPLVLGHQIVGTVEKVGEKVTHVKVGDRVGVPWLGGCCGTCEYCRSGHENLCSQALYTGYHIDGGFAEYCVASGRFVLALPKSYPDLQAAPLLCAGLIGFRALRMTGKAQRIGFYGFGSSAHILTQIVQERGGEVYAFTKKGDVEKQEFAKKLGAVWAGNSEEKPPSALDAAIIFAPSGPLVPLALQAVKKGGTVVCAGIHMSDIPSFPYTQLWGERVLRSVANLTRKDGENFLALAPAIPIQTEVHTYPFESANVAIDDLRKGRFSGSAVLKIIK